MVQLYKSIETLADTSEAVLNPNEFLGSLVLHGVPLSGLQLKVAMPIILLRNPDSPELCN